MLQNCHRDLSFVCRMLMWCLAEEFCFCWLCSQQIWRLILLLPLDQIPHTQKCLLVQGQRQKNNNKKKKTSKQKGHKMTSLIIHLEKIHQSEIFNSINLIQRNPWFGWALSQKINKPARIRTYLKENLLLFSIQYSF